jgi:uncharacterized membrane protein
VSRLRDLLIDGLLLALPLVAIGLLVQKLVDLVAHLLTPVANLFPGHYLGVAGIDLAAFALLVVLMVLIGVFARSGPGAKTSQLLERWVLRKIPGFLLFKAVAVGFSSEERDAGMTPALIAFDDHVELGFVVEPADGPEGLVTVFVPGAPAPTSGAVVLVAASRVTLLGASVNKTMHAVSRLGLGTQQLVADNAAAKEVR